MSRETKVRVKARVRLVVEIDVSDCWGGDCPMSQVNKQARESAVQHVTTMRKGGPLVLDPSITIIGEPVVTSVVTEEQS